MLRLMEKHSKARKGQPTSWVRYTDLENEVPKFQKDRVSYKEHLLSDYVKSQEIYVKFQ